MASVRPAFCIDSWYRRGFRPIIFLAGLVVLWDLAIRILHIPPYQIPAPQDVLITLWNDWPKLLSQAWPTTVSTLWGFLLYRRLRHSDRHADRRLPHGRKLRLSVAGFLEVDPENRDRAAVRGLVWLRHAAEGAVRLPARVFSGGRLGGARVQVGRARHARPRPRDGSEPPADHSA